MLYMIGTLTLDVALNVDTVDRDASADLATKPVIGGLEPSEFMGEGKDEFILSGQLLPTKIGGLDELEIAHQMRRDGTRVPLMRGDGSRLGTFAITRIAEKHEDLVATGVGFRVRHTITLKKVQPDAAAGRQVIFGLLSLFGAI
ncbi:phage tail protein [Afifella sp. H1R]|uniref:phage tail protein n=1 Tax=Afifella sp. H1R TaxID=2908841 RepID=UPI001F417410|nr:phage tail protein [Afifella sp. H1R]MCF1502894.1 phage tail protein [Afifella sp. H1R]